MLAPWDSIWFAQHIAPARKMSVAMVVAILPIVILGPTMLAALAVAVSGNFYGHPSAIQIGLVALDTLIFCLSVCLGLYYAERRALERS